MRSVPPTQKSRPESCRSRAYSLASCWAAATHRRALPRRRRPTRMGPCLLGAVLEEAGRQDMRRLRSVLRRRMTWVQMAARLRALIFMVPSRVL